MLPCEPGMQVAFPDGEVVPWWPEPERTASEWSRYSKKDSERFLAVDAELKKLARYLQPFFLEPPPDVNLRGVSGLLELSRIGKRFRGIKGDEIARMVSFLTGSLGDFLDRNFTSDVVKTMYVGNNVYGKHGGPYQAGTAIGLLFHLLSGGDHDLQGFYGHVMGGMGAITEAMASACRKAGVEIRTSAPVSRSPSMTAPPRGWCSRTGPRSLLASSSRTPTPRGPSSNWSNRRRSPTIFAPPSRASRWTVRARR